MSHLIVTADIDNPQRGTLQCGQRSFPCVLGRSGVALQKREGDGATPRGKYPLRRIYYRADKLSAPRSALPLTALARDDGWCDAPDDRNYNRPVKLPYGASAENMWRDDALYDVVVVIGYNDDPIVPAAGSAIFIHVVATNGEPTAGCVALARDDLLSILAQTGPGSTIEIR